MSKSPQLAFDPVAMSESENMADAATAKAAATTKVNTNATPPARRHSARTVMLSRKAREAIIATTEAGWSSRTSAFVAPRTILGIKRSRSPSPSNLQARLAPKQQKSLPATAQPYTPKRELTEHVKPTGFPESTELVQPAGLNEPAVVRDFPSPSKKSTRLATEADISASSSKTKAANSDLNKSRISFVLNSQSEQPGVGVPTTTPRAATAKADLRKLELSHILNPQNEQPEAAAEDLESNIQQQASDSQSHPVGSEERDLPKLVLWYHNNPQKYKPLSVKIMIRSARTRQALAAQKAKETERAQNGETSGQTPPSNFNNTLLADPKVLRKFINESTLGSSTSPMMAHLSQVIQNNPSTTDTYQGWARASAARMMSERESRIRACKLLWIKYCVSIKLEIQTGAGERTRSNNDPPPPPKEQQPRVLRLIKLYNRDPERVFEALSQVEKRRWNWILNVLNYHEDITWEANGRLPVDPSIPKDNASSEVRSSRSSIKYEPLTLKITSIVKMEYLLDFILGSVMQTTPLDGDGAEITSKICSSLRHEKFYQELVNNVLLDAEDDEEEEERKADMNDMVVDEPETGEQSGPAQAIQPSREEMRERIAAREQEMEAAAALNQIEHPNLWDKH